MITGKYVRLRAVEHSDLPQFVAWLNDLEVTAGLSHYLPMSLTDEEHWYESMVQRPREEHPLVIEVRENSSWKMIGNLGLMGIDWRNRSAEVGIFIGEKELWGKGYGSEAMALMLQHAFETLNLNRVMLRVFETNLRAIRSYEKVGFTPEGRLRQAEHQNGEYIDVLLMSILRSEWKQKNRIG